jgi:hypothetical protein
VVGILAGPLVHRGFGGRRNGPPSPQAIADRLGHRLDLKPAQRDSVQAILERHRPVMDSLWRDFRPRIHAVEETVQREISAQLDAEQQQKFRELTQRFDRMRQDGPAGPPR